MAAVAASKLALAAHFDGFLSGDDLEVVEAAAKYALGLDYAPWSLRCLFHPVVLVAPVLEAGAALGVRGPLEVAWLAVLPTLAASTATVWLVFRFAGLLGWPRRVGTLAAFFYATHWLPLGYGATPYPRPISTMLFMLAMVLVLERPAAWTVVGGFLMGAAFAVRFSEGVLLLPFLWMVRVRHRRVAALGLALAGFLVGAVLCVGLTDWLTWGRPFSSLSEFVRITYLNPPPSFPRYDKPWFWYGVSVLRWAGPVAVLLVFAATQRAGWRRPAFLLLLIVAGYSIFAYKAYRYLQASIPLLALLMGIGCAELLGAAQKWRRAAGVAALVLAPAWGAERTIGLMREKSRPAVEAASFLRSLGVRVVLLEQAWAYGDRLTLGPGVDIRDLEPRTPIALAESALEGVDGAAFYARDLSPADRAVLERRGFRDVRHVPGRKAVVVFRRGDRSKP
jgi:hypothetical protein